LLRFLFNNKDVFAWSGNDLCGVNRDIIEHSLNVDPALRPRKQRLRKMSDDEAEGARNELKRLLSASCNTPGVTMARAHLDTEDCELYEVKA
jgi:hypothetical protein